MLFAEQLRDAALAMGLPADAARVQRSDRPDLCDFQSNIGFAGAKLLKQPPAQVANALAEQITDPTVEVSVVAGFVNFRLRDEALADMLRPLRKPEPRGETVLLDYGGPNIAKPMHVGHLRSLVIGDALKYIGRWLGYWVTSDIHLGDWGYQMGLLLAYSKAKTLDQLESDYVAASEKAKSDPDFKREAQRQTLALQSGDEVAVRKWKQFVDLSMSSVMQDLTHGLGTLFDFYLGESAASIYMDKTLEALKDVTRESDGALIAGDYDPPLLLKNSEGAYLYAATDLATLLLRKDLSPTPDRIIYVVDERQALHFQQVFDLAKYVTDAKLEHVGFGTVNDANGKPFKTRQGGVPRLSMLVEEAIMKASERIDDIATARWVALAAIKFADLQARRTSGYSFDLDKALAMEGKTGPYLLYQHVRITSICGKATVKPGYVSITSPEQRQLAIELLAFEDAVEAAWEQRMPHLLADYVYALSQRFSTLYGAEQVSNSPSNLALAILTRERLDASLRMLGLQPVERM